MERTYIARLLALGIACVTVLGVLPLVVADDNYINQFVTVNVEPSGYPSTIAPNQYWFVPGDSIELTLNAWVEGNDGIDDKYDIIVFPAGETAWDQRVKIFDDVEVNEDGDATATITGDTTEDLKDGYYDVYVGPIDWVQNQGFDGPDNEYDSDNFRIQMYRIIAETNKLGYIPGDTITVFYSIISIKDGSLITEEAYEGLSFDDREWAVWSQDGETHEEYENLDESSGSFSFKISNTGSATDWYVIGIYANATFGDSREAATFLYANPGDFSVSDLGLQIWTDRSTYQIDSVVQVRVFTYVTGTWPQVPEEGVSVEIEIMEGVGTDADAILGYGGDFVSDASGMVSYAFSVQSGDFEIDKTYTARASVEKWLKEDTQDDTFDVEAGGRAISVNLAFDKAVYTTGDMMTVTIGASVPVGGNTDLTYIYKITDDQGGTRDQGVTDTNVFTFDIPDNFEGTLTFDVEVFNADGDFGSISEDKEVHYAVILLNAEPEQYEAGDVIEAEYELISNLGAPASFFYHVRDAGAGIVLEGEISGTETTGMFEYTVPDVPSAYYTFYIYANLIYQEQGIMVTSDDTCRLKAGYDFEIWVDDPNYEPGARVVIHYKISPQTDEGLPDKFMFTYGMSNGQSYTWQTDSEKGDIYYELPSGVNEGNVVLFAYVYDGDGNWLGSASEVLHVQSGANPLEWTKFGDVPLMSIILLILIIILIIVMLFRRPAAPAPAKPAEAPPAEPEPIEEPVTEPPEASPLTINCKSCGAEIEITTSKRPIEVMCPSCGETEMVE